MFSSSISFYVCDNLNFLYRNSFFPSFCLFVLFYAQKYNMYNQMYWGKTYKRKCCRLGSNLSALYFEYPFKFLSYYYGYSYFLGRKVIKRIICKKKAFKRLQKFWIYVKKWWKDCLSLFLYSPNIHKWEFSYIIKWEIHVWNFIKLSQIMYLVIKYLACYILPYIFLWYQFKAK